LLLTVTHLSVPWQFLQFSDLSSSLQYWAQHTPFVRAQLVSLQEFAGTVGRAAGRLRPGSSETAGPRHASVEVPPLPPLPVEPALPLVPPLPVGPALPPLPPLLVEPALPPLPTCPPLALPAEPDAPPSADAPDVPPDEAEPPLPTGAPPPAPPVEELPDPFEHVQATSRQRSTHFLSDNISPLSHTRRSTAKRGREIGGAGSLRDRGLSMALCDGPSVLGCPIGAGVAGWQ